MKKKQSIATLLILAVLTALLAYTVANGWGATGTGAAKNTVIRTSMNNSIHWPKPKRSLE